ncbi:hypothetical protein KAFR_0D02150 [Kazachstania africana CBS 2517]|uniref:DUF1748-domain-containing protein n=1 Tax=Kazachstania africana (strain ATCC 22294 / BCRC 22015 / CBS 2517 / CECT 1963 / NBRC 1671 / NRRL Y-8276) TaxID=1071382 RepID=H2AU12_KAZAF|nr:hypothetical protein KAFR_0D02150 [Kazachstania africana CBS 2517]CCF57862.1 hypothetical protein KAFR_0D02150 [Kazachstania africana CBS 2517]
MTLLGKTVHITADLILVATCLAGIRRNTGLTPNLRYVKNDSIRDYTARYLKFGESCYDYSVAKIGASKYFSRK